MKLEVYKPEHINLVIAILENVQGLLEVEDPEVLFMMIEDAIDILVEE